MVRSRSSLLSKSVQIDRGSLTSSAEIAIPRVRLDEAGCTLGVGTDVTGDRPAGVPISDL
jgi:hypothetical protein